MISRARLMAGLLMASTLAQESSAVSFDLLTRIGDDGEAEGVSIELDAGDTRTIRAAGGLHYSIAVTDRGNEVAVALRLMDAQSRQLHRAQVLGYERPGAHLRVAFVVCDDRVILQRPAPDRTASCADLPALAALDPNPTDCVECVGAYEGMPANILSRARIAPEDANGEPLTVTGRALGPDGKPRSGVIVYAFQTDVTGIYPMPAVPRSTHSQSHGEFRGWALTDAAGRYTFDTIRPGGYPDQGEPQHIHMVVIEPGCGMYFVEDVHFTDDPRLGNLSEEQLPNYFTGVFGGGVTTPALDEAGTWRVTRDLYIGRGLDQYSECNRQ